MRGRELGESESFQWEQKKQWEALTLERKVRWSEGLRDKKKKPFPSSDKAGFNTDVPANNFIN